MPGWASNPSIAAVGLDRQGVDPRAEQIGEHLVHHAVSLETAQPFEPFRHDLDLEMGLATRPRTAMPSMLV